MYGQHVEEEQSSELKEAIVNLSNQRQPEREARKSAEMRTPKVLAQAQLNYEAAASSRAAEGSSEDLSHDSQSRKQLVSRAQTLLARMMAAEERQQPECPEIGRDATAFRVRRNTEWELLFKREAKALEGEMRTKRKQGRTQLITNPYGHVRGLMKQRREASYVANADALAAAEAKVAEAKALMAAAERDLEVAASKSGKPDGGQAAPAPKKARMKKKP